MSEPHDTPMTCPFCGAETNDPCWALDEWYVCPIGDANTPCDPESIEAAERRIRALLDRPAPKHRDDRARRHGEKRTGSKTKKPRRREPAGQYRRGGEERNREERY